MVLLSDWIKKPDTAGQQHRRQVLQPERDKKVSAPSPIEYSSANKRSFFVTVKRRNLFHNRFLPETIV
jgi:hypothetical protein